MGQLFSQQAAPRSRLDRSRNISRSQHTRREVRPLEATTGNIQATSNIKASRREEFNSSRKRPTSSVQDIRTNPYSSERFDGVSGVPRHQSTYVRSKASKDAPRTKHHEHKSTRDVDDQQLAGRRTGTKDHKARSRLSRSDSHHTSVRFTKNCIVCTDTRSLHRFPDRTPTNQCTHDVDVCRRCLRAWIQSEFSTKIWNEINCPVCATRMQYEDISEFAPKDVFHRYDKLATKAACESIPNFYWCITKGCKSGQVQEPGNNKFRCKACNKSHCIEHGIAWHKRETCREYDYRTNKSLKKQEEAASKRTITETTKKCPGCKRSIEKSYGCDHMTCSKCRHQFCYQCLAPYQKKGERRVTHREGCEYYEYERD